MDPQQEMQLMRERQQVQAQQMKGTLKKGVWILGGLYVAFWLLRRA